MKYLVSSPLDYTDTSYYIASSKESNSYIELFFISPFVPSWLSRVRIKLFRIKNCNCSLLDNFALFLNLLLVFRNTPPGLLQFKHKRLLPVVHTLMESYTYEVLECVIYEHCFNVGNCILSRFSSNHSFHQKIFSESLLKCVSYSHK